MTTSILQGIEYKRRKLSSLNRAPVGLGELAITFLISVFVTPFFAVTFTVLPFIGQMVVIPVFLLTIYYLLVRRSLAVAFIALAGSALVMTTVFASIQSIKYHLEIPLFLFLVLGIPVSIIYSLLLGMRIWKILER